jgi:Caspase domain
MSKAAVVIGVNKTGDLPVLKDAAASASRVAVWLTGEGYQTRTLLDERASGVRASVRARDVFLAVAAALETGTCEQLVLYFSGHGYLNDGSEHWLLSGAPTDPNEAIDLEENIQLARDCGVRNVIFVSDACRSTPQSIKADRVRGSIIFPNTGVSATTRADVDRFFACLPGDPAYEVAVDKSSGVYSALFTHCLENAYLDTPEAMTSDVDGVEVLSNRRLKGLLPGLVEVRANKFSATLFQKPDAIVESDPEIYLGRVRRSPAPAVLQSARPQNSAGIGGLFERLVPLDNLLSGITGVERRRGGGRPAEGDRREPPSKMAPDAPTLSSHGENLLAEALNAAAYSGSPAEPSPPLTRAIAIAAQIACVDQFENSCGFGVRGADVVEVLGLGCSAEIIHSSRAGEDRRVRIMPAPQGLRTPFSRTVLLRFDGGDCAAIPAIEGYIATIVVDRECGGDEQTGGVVQVAYTPAQNDYRFGEFLAKRTEVERLRSLVAALARKGVLNLSKVAGAFAEKIRDYKAYDPTFGIYAGYAYNDTGLSDEIRTVERFMRPNLEDATVYDIALLLRKAKASVYPNLLPFCPMLSQGWSLLRVLGGEIPSAVRDASRFRRASLWTTFKSAGADILFNAARDGDLR